MSTATVPLVSVPVASGHATFVYNHLLSPGTKIATGHVISTPKTKNGKSEKQSGIMKGWQ